MNEVAAPSLLIRPERITPFARGNGTETLPYVGKWNSSEASLTTGITVLPPGNAIPVHTHNVEEFVLVLEGEGIVTIDDKAFEISTGTGTWVPPGVPHNFMNNGPGVLRILWTYAGVQITRTISATGETFEHLSERDASIAGKM